MGAQSLVPNRLIVDKAHWLNDAGSPVVLMIDDLTNAWHNRQAAGSWEHGGDWGAGGHRSGSALQFLEDRLLREYPEVRATFFTVAGPISAYTWHQPFGYAAPMDADAESRKFFSDLAADPRFELAYHGYNHGTPGETSETFLQEWRGFPSRAEAVAQTQRGLAIFANAIGSRPRGGKYGGWDYNEFADGAVDECGFLWWCRDWTPRDVARAVADAYYEPQFFGRNMVVALPSTIHGHFWDPRQVDVLLAKRQIISIEEHIAPIRPDGRVQTPNIVDDIDDLRRLYQHLRGRSVWHANATDIASYVIARERSRIYDVTLDGFSVHYDGPCEQPSLTLRLDCIAVCNAAAPQIAIALPDGRQLDAAAIRFDPLRFRHVATVPVMNGRYAVRSVA
jgi:hypothetical protein